MNLKKEKIKKYFIYIFYFSIIFLLIFFIYKNFAVVGEFEKNAGIVKKAEKKESLEKRGEKDTDGDGLKDWQEILYKTDIELADTDGDGISDFEEVKNNTDPVVFGKGKSDEIKKVKKKIEGETEFEKLLKEQKKERNKIALLKKKEKPSQADLEKIKNEKKRKLALKKMLNSVAEKMIENNYQSEKEGFYYKNLFKYFNQNNENKIKKSVSEEEFGKLKKVEYREFTESELKDFETLAYAYVNTAKGIDSVDVDYFDLDGFFETLVESYKIMGEKTISLIKMLQNNENNQEEANKIIQEYGEAVRLNIENRVMIGKFIDVNNINFYSSEAGRIFVYSL